MRLWQWNESLTWAQHPGFHGSLLSEYCERQPYTFARSSDGFPVMHINTLSGTRDRLERMIDGSGLVKSHLLSQQMGKKSGITCGIADPFWKFTPENIILAFLHTLERASITNQTLGEWLLSFQECNFNKIARSLHQPGELVLISGVVKQLFLCQTKKCHSICNSWLAAHWAYKLVLSKCYPGPCTALLLQHRRHPGEEKRDEKGFVQSKPMNGPWETWATYTSRESTWKCSEVSALASFHVGSVLHNLHATLILPDTYFKNYSTTSYWVSTMLTALFYGRYGVCLGGWKMHMC